jgi:hypothetical protein
MTPVTKNRSGGVPCSAPKGLGADSAMGGLEASDATPIKFGSFSLGDVFEREITKLG